jgi:hypothetical protein
MAFARFSFGRTSDEAAGASLSALLIVQCLTQFVVIPFGATHASGHLLLDVCHLTFTAVCIAALTRHLAVRAALLAGLAVLAVVPALGRRASEQLGLDSTTLHEAIALVALAFNGLFTALIARHVFGPGRVTAHRVWGAVLLYLNVSAIFAILYSLLLTHAPGAIASTTSSPLDLHPGVKMAELTYFSLATITTAGYGDFAPVHPLARSLANLESIIGQLFPATLLARLVALHLSHQSYADPERRPAADPEGSSETDDIRRGG